MTAEENWDGLVQKAIREYDAALGHKPYAVEFPKHQCPTGGATVYVRPSEPGNQVRRECRTGAHIPSCLASAQPNRFRTCTRCLGCGAYPGDMHAFDCPPSSDYGIGPTTVGFMRGSNKSSGNPYAHIDESTDMPQRAVDVQLPPYEETQ